MTLLLLAIWCLSKRWARAGAYLMPIMLIYCFGGQAFWAYYEEIQFNPHDWQYTDFKTYVMQEVQSYMNYVLFVFLFSPSMPFTCFVYIPTFLIGKLFLDVQIHPADTTMVIFLIIQCICMIASPTLVFYIVHNSDISRFYS